MTQTNTDYLLQITPAVTDRPYGATVPNDDVGRFDDHLSQAATFSGDEPHNRGSSSQRTDTTRYGRDDRSWSTGASKPSNHDSDNSPSSPTSQVDHEQTDETVSESKPPAEAADGDEHKSEKADDMTAAEVAGASQTATGDTKKVDSKSEPKTNSNAAATAKAAADRKKAAIEAGGRKATANANSQKTNGSSSPDAAAPHAVEAATHAVEAATLVADATTDTATKNDEPGEPQTTASEGKRTKAIKGETSTAKSNKGASASNDAAVCNDSSIDEAGTEQISLKVPQKANNQVEASATVAAAATSTENSDAVKSSDDDSRTDSQNEVRAAARNDAPAPTNKVDAAQLAGSIPTPTDAGANAPSKSKDDDQATKPVAAKSEPVAAAFARMTRNNITDSNASTSGTNDLPQVDPSRFIGRVAKAFQTAQDRGGTLQLRLSPPELGALRIELNVKDGVMSASLQTENANARRLLLDHLPALRDRLAEQNIRVDRFDVDVRRENTGGQTDTRGSQQQQFQHQPDQPAPQRQAQSQQRPREVAAPERTVIAPSVSDTGLNLIV